MSSENNETDYNSKGKCFGLFMLGLLLFVLLVTYIYNSNWNGLDTSIK